MTNLQNILFWNIEFTLEGISKTRRHIYFYALLVLGSIAANTVVRL